MKNFKIFIFIPLAIAISSIILYIYNIMYYRNAKMLVTAEVQKILKTYIFIAVLGIIIFIVMEILFKYLVMFKSQTRSNYNFEKEFNALEKEISKEVIRCKKCGQIVEKDDNYCRNCGNDLKKKLNINIDFLKNIININKDALKNIINVIEMVVLIIFLYILVMFVFEFKANTDSNFKVPIFFRLLK